MLSKRLAVNTWSRLFELSCYRIWAIIRESGYVPCPHLHIYREGYGVKWAYPVPSDFTNTTDLVRTLQDFLRYCKVEDIPPIQRSVN